MQFWEIEQDEITFIFSSAEATRR